MVLLAPKTDLVALPGVAGSNIAVMPHLWGLTCWRRRGCWKPRLRAHRVDLRPADDPAIIAAADVSQAVAWAPGPPPHHIPREASHVVGLAECDNRLYALLA